MRSFAALALTAALPLAAGQLAAGQLADAGGNSVVDRAALAEQVRQAELAFAASVKENRPDLFAGFLDEGAVFVGGQEITRGKAAIVTAWSPYFAAGRPQFEWHPEIVELSADGTLGFTRGPWTLRARKADGSESESSGIFNSIWRRQADGGWKVIFDAGCSPCPACGD